MTGDHHKPPAGAAAVPVTVALTPGPVHADWCPACKAWTRYVGELLLLTDEGVGPVGGWAWCETCDDGMP